MGVVCVAYLCESGSDSAESQKLGTDSTNSALNTEPGPGICAVVGGAGATDVPCTALLVLCITMYSKSKTLCAFIDKKF